LFAFLSLSSSSYQSFSPATPSDGLMRSKTLDLADLPVDEPRKRKHLGPVAFVCSSVSSADRAGQVPCNQATAT
jgi:hypothetical protein